MLIYLSLSNIQVFKFNEILEEVNNISSFFSNFNPVQLLQSQRNLGCQYQQYLVVVASISSSNQHSRSCNNLNNCFILSSYCPVHVNVNLINIREKKSVLPICSLSIKLIHSSPSQQAIKDNKLLFYYTCLVIQR